MVAWRHNFVAVFGVMQDHGAVPHSAVQYNHGVVPHDAMQKGSDCENFAGLVYFVLKFQKRVNCSHFHGGGGEKCEPAEQGGHSNYKRFHDKKIVKNEDQYTSWACMCKHKLRLLGTDHSFLE
jgi:hypothetical protein